MKKTIFLFLWLAGTCSILFGQSTAESQTDAKTYSESKPYQPAAASNGNSEKRQKPKVKDEKNSAVSEINPDRSVIVPVTVFDRSGKFVTGLNKSDFRIFADEREIDDYTLENVDTPLNIILLLDTSPSSAFKISELQDYAMEIVDELAAQDKILVAEFNEKLKIRTNFTGDKKIAASAIRKLRFGDGTALYDAVQEVFEKIAAASEGRTAIILITDGVDTTSTKSSYAKSLNTAEKYHIPVFVNYIDSFAYSTQATKNGGVILSPSKLSGILPQYSTILTKSEYETGESYLNDLMSLSGGRVASFKPVSAAPVQKSPNFIQEMRQRYYLKFTSSAAAESGATKQLKIRVNRPNLLVLAKASYLSN